jgi:hypothetical protein
MPVWKCSVLLAIGAVFGHGASLVSHHAAVANHNQELAGCVCIWPMIYVPDINSYTESAFYSSTVARICCSTSNQ